MGATRAAYSRRLQEGYFERIFVGSGIDIGYGCEPVTPTCDTFDQADGDGDAQFLPGVPLDHYDWVYSSHCLEHLHDPEAALLRWGQSVKPGGYLFVVVPDEDLYEQGHWPSPFNTDHKATFTIEKEKSWSPVSRNLTEMAARLADFEVVSIRRIDAGYDYSGGVWDRTLGDHAEAHIEMILKKRDTP